ncbi:UNVERIFIED_CONTAM: hypothetical protein FKN15_053510 [Acipenser sinensis]
MYYLEFLTYLPPPWGDCQSTVSDSDFFRVYSITACRIDCETRYLVENCNCKMVHMPGDAAFCTPEQYKECAEPALDFVEKEMHISPNTVVLKDLQKLLKDVQSLKSQLSLIATHAKGLVDLIQWFESREVRVHQTYNKAAELINTYRAMAQEVHSTDAAINKLCVKTFHDVSEKLTNYYNLDQCKKKPCFFQPAHNFLMAVFDPQQVCSLDLEALPLYSIPGFDADKHYEAQILDIKEQAQHSSAREHILAKPCQHAKRSS